MATLLKPSILLKFLVITLILVPSSYARLAHTKLSSVPRKMNGHDILRKLGYDVSITEYYRRRWLLQGADPDRVSPGGPDPQHH
ncbi:conserved hypothetical protein [Ricinus communis]|uniref:Uncharacterized protein n=1 Tax=Ricinus communis TaxID=3988 RepID=B9SE45_RICCO|nr:conserved hypothetical protein [Ricinus communis]